MMKLLRIAFRNLGRSRARTALSIGAIGVSVMMVLLLKGSVDGILNSMEDGTIRLSAGHVRLIDQEYKTRERLLSLQYLVDGYELDYSEVGYQPMLKDLGALDGVAHVAPRVRFGAMVSHGEDLRNVVVVAGEPQTEAELMRVDRYLVEGRYVEEGTREAAMGRRLLQRLGMNVGDRFTLVFSTSLGALRGYTFSVVGAFESGMAYLDDGHVFIPLDVAQTALDLGAAATEVLIFATDSSETPALLAQVEDLLKAEGADQRYTAIPWYTHNEMMEYLQVADRIYGFIYIAVLLLSSFVVVNTFVMIVNERRREIGMLSALGLRPGQIRTLFLLEGGICGLIGSLIGTTLGGVLVWFLSQVGIELAGAESMGAEIMYPTTLYPMFSSSVISFAFIGGLLVTVAAVYLPARQAARLKPTEALRT